MREIELMTEDIKGKKSKNLTIMTASVSNRIGLTLSLSKVLIFHWPTLRRVFVRMPSIG